MSNKGRVFVVSGPSGVGKTTILNLFLKNDNNSVFSISYTTRKRRENEREGVDYHFVTMEEFQEMVKKDFFIEWEEVHGEFYGTPKATILESIERGVDVFLDIDVNGALRIKRIIPASVLIFIEPPSENELMKRLKIRGEKEIEKRLQRVSRELETKKFFDYVIINDSLEKAYNQFKNIVEEVRKSNGKNNS
ncbi:MAG: guanylate kinase [Deltaproteobacteria bacterium]|nr:guanylate kinase [Deltaproteobacteria bacterium]